MIFIASVPPRKRWRIGFLKYSGRYFVIRLSVGGYLVVFVSTAVVVGVFKLLSMLAVSAMVVIPFFSAGNESASQAGSRLRQAG
ncbi:hypothetical protein NDU88_006393 [Pleurodeles waltl]|uniref:Uncharacterized protein n=1 Tax=Pleurodeles waltl TaxID=8319 RepID=A0AAV7SPQ6_PLEWA|nr:hypothetical protein NDU88_006393 [Pleurodeles waltl]